MPRQSVHHRGREQPRRRPPPAAETGSRSRGHGRRGDVPPKGRWPMRAPQPVRPRRLAYRRAKTVQWTILEHKSLHSLIGRKGGCTIPFGGAHAPCKRLHSPRGDRALIVHHTEKSERILLQMRSDLFFYMVYLIFKVRFMGLELWLRQVLFAKRVPVK